MERDFDKECILRIKEKGHLIAMDLHRQYWVVNDILYSVNADGVHFDIWCALSRLEQHLRSLWQITGQKMFTDDEHMVIYDYAFLNQFEYA